MGDIPDAFQLANTRLLRALGVRGAHAWAAVRRGAIEVHGQDGGIVRLEPAEVARVRIGYSEGRWRTYRTALWRSAGGAPIELVPISSSWREYRNVIGAFIELLTSSGRADRLEIGDSIAGAALAPALLGVVALAALVVSFVALPDTPWWARLLVPFVPGVLCAILVRAALRRTWPRPLRRPEELDGQLPPLPAD